MTSKCGKNISDTLGCASCATFLFLPHFDVICDLLLNRRTATWNLFVNFIVERIYKETFGSDLLKKPKPFRISLVITAVFLAWTRLVRHKVLQIFQLCKDIEYSCLLFLLDEVIPLSFFHYPVTFRSGNLDDYMAIMLKLSILFITWQRRHNYDRSMLSMLSDFCFRKHHFPQHHELMKKWLVLTT